MKRDNHGFDEKLADIIYAFVDFKDKGIPVKNDEVKTLVKKWQRYLTENCYECTDELLEALGAMYAGEDFRDKIDVFGKGTAFYMSLAINEYCKGLK